jgi:hypothetical protein
MTSESHEAAGHLLRLEWPGIGRKLNESDIGRRFVRCGPTNVRRPDWSYVPLSSTAEPSALRSFILNAITDSHFERVDPIDADLSLASRQKFDDDKWVPTDEFLERIQGIAARTICLTCNQRERETYTHLSIFTTLPIRDYNTGHRPLVEDWRLGPITSPPSSMDGDPRLHNHMTVTSDDEDLDPDFQSDQLA